jgi:hypothetical protein
MASLASQRVATQWRIKNGRRGRAPFRCASGDRFMSVDPSVSPLRVKGNPSLGQQCGIPSMLLKNSACCARGESARKSVATRRVMNDRGPQDRRF